MRRVRSPRAAAFLAMAAACLAAGCAAPGSATPGAGPWPTQQASGTTTVTILSGVDTSDSSQTSEPGMYAELIDWWNTYEEPRTRIRIALDTVAGGATAEHSEMLAAAETGSAAADIYNLDNEWVPEFAAAGYIRSLQDHLPQAGFLRPPLDSGRYGSQLYAAPFTTDVGLLYYRKDLVSASQVNRLDSFTGLTELAQKTMSAGHEPTIGYAGQFAAYEGLTVNLLEIIHSDDPDAFAANGQIRDSNAVTQGLQQLYDAMYLTGIIAPSELDFQEAQAVTAFAAGKALFMRNWPVYYQQLIAAGGKGSINPQKQLGVAPLPFPSVLGGQDLAISTTSANPAAALRVIEYLTSPEAEQCLFAVGGFPATRSSAYTQKAPLPTGYDHVKGQPLCGTAPGPSLAIGPEILQGISTAFSRPRTPYYTEFSTIVQTLVPRLLNGYDLADLVSTLEPSLNAAASGHAPPPQPPRTPPATEATGS